MNGRRRLVMWLGAAMLVGAPLWAGDDSEVWAATGNAAEDTLVAQVRAGTERFKKLERAQDAGYGLFHGCVSGPQGGAMGVHFVNGDLVGDGEIDASKPEAIMYEWHDGRPQIVGVEFVVIADQWNAAHDGPPVLGGQLFTYNTAPNRYGIPAFYALHVWAWRPNPDGVFSDWNRKVSCAEFTEGSADSHGGH
jgi:hypothetical protein